MTTEVMEVVGAPAKPAVPEGYTVITEGSASILQKANDVFYNPAQVINRDISVAVLRRFVDTLAANAPTRGKGRKGIRKAGSGGQIKVLEAMAASGLRAIRYAKEIPGITQVVANDLDANVVRAMKRNIEFNGAQGKITAQTSDCRLTMLSNEGAFDIVDLDPYGSPCHVLDSAVQAVADGGLLAVTATDMAVLCGNNGEACWSKYGCYPIHRSYCHEQALRILLATLESHANRTKRYIEPLLSLSIDFYIRVFVRVHHSATEVKSSATKQMYLYQSQGCDSFYTQRVGRKVMKNNSTRYVPGQGPAVPEKCPETGAGFLFGGPLWAEPLHNMEWAQALLQDVNHHKERYPAHAKVASILTAVLEELPDVPLYFSLHDVCRTLRASSPKADVFKSAIINAGYRASPTHCNPLGVKTDAPWDVIWDIMRCWVQEHPVKKPEEGSYTAKLLGKETVLKADFARAHGALSIAKRNKQARFLPNPAPNWGPKARHRSTGEGHTQRPTAAVGHGKDTDAAAEEGGDAGVDVCMIRSEQQQHESAVQETGEGLGGGGADAAAQEATAAGVAAGG